MMRAHKFLSCHGKKTDISGKGYSAVIRNRDLQYICTTFADWQCITGVFKR